MQTIQLVLSDASYARKLKQLLADNGNWPVSIKELPSFGKGGVVVLDDKVLSALASPPDFPDRVVLITRNEPAILSHAWDLGIRSVVYDSDTSSTLLLAIMSAWLRLPKVPQVSQRRVNSPNAPTPFQVLDPQSRSNRRH
ncbi:MAG: hypothetical protein SGI92_24465 [Bryobacteraceae bacterium]|nr:hypothetical protein [Bryobacteraceae bacterium]